MLSGLGGREEEEMLINMHVPYSEQSSVFLMGRHTVRRERERDVGSERETQRDVESETRERECVSPVVQGVPNGHVVGQLLPQGGLELALRLDGLQGLSQLPLGDLLQAHRILQLAVQELCVLLQTPDLVLQALELHLERQGVFRFGGWCREHSPPSHVAGGNGGQGLRGGGGLVPISIYISFH